MILTCFTEVSTSVGKGAPKGSEKGKTGGEGGGGLSIRCKQGHVKQ